MVDLRQSESQEILDVTEALANRGIIARFRWIPEHSGIAGHEKADREAERACHQKCQHSWLKSRNTNRWKSNGLKWSFRPKGVGNRGDGNLRLHRAGAR
jgi:hypothetical protein